MTGAIIHIAWLLAGLASQGDAGSSRGAGRDGGAQAPPAVSARAEVEAALGKGGAAELQRLAATAQGPLMVIASDRTRSEMVRSRALSALAYARNLRVASYLENFIVLATPSSDATDRVLLRRAAVSLGWQGDGRLVETIAPLLDHTDREVRLDAAIALGLGRTRSAEAPLRARLANETDSAVRRQLEASIKAVTAPR
jgi:HEAT repeats